MRYFFNKGFVFSPKSSKKFFQLMLQMEYKRALDEEHEEKLKKS